jgi:hypothetical protein
MAAFDAAADRCRFVLAVFVSNARTRARVGVLSPGTLSAIFRHIGP